MNSVKNWTKFLVDNGLVFEINRKVLHPLGLSMEVGLDFDSKRKLAIREIIKTDDPEGFLYDEESYAENSRKLELYMARTGNRAIENRKRILGFVEQENESLSSKSVDGV